MPSFFEVWPEIKSALLRPTAKQGDEPEVDPFARLIGLMFEASMDRRKALAAVEVLRDEQFLSPEALATADLRELEETLRAGHAPVGPKALRPAQRVAAWIHESGESIEGLSARPISTLRDALLGLNGVGQATADALLLFGLGLPSYPVDRATYRILQRHGWIDSAAEYGDVLDTVMTAVGEEPETLGELSVAFEGVGRQYCKAGGPKCDQCILRTWLPETGPIQE